jgi:hypothetical protein
MEPGDDKIDVMASGGIPALLGSTNPIAEITLGCPRGVRICIILFLQRCQGVWKTREVGYKPSIY